MKKIFLLVLLILSLGLSSCKKQNPTGSFPQIGEQNNQNHSTQDQSPGNTQNQSPKDIPQVNVISPENKNELPSSKSFTDEYGDMYVITIEKFEKNLQAANEWQKLQEGETIVGVYFKVQNNGNHFKWISYMNFALEDYTGYTYSSRVFDVVNHKPFEDIINLAPGKSCEGWIFFIVPKTVLNNHFILLYNIGDYLGDFNGETLQFNLN